MKKWMITVLALGLSVVLIIGFTILIKANSPFNKTEKQAVALAVKEKVIAEVQDAYVYNSELSYITVRGKDEEGNSKTVFVPSNFKASAIQEVYNDDGITKNQALTQLQETANVQKVLHTKLGYEEPGAVWEITYIDANNQLNYMYYLFESGEEWKRILNL
ncbi:peptidase M4 [Lysinibacillus alkalisoli]|uniref:Peptidase M4 n=1 Tax=Lysinibacillus alkalisoli TaxID=1911548 RepID=A0A917G1X5_9BACI|nr:DUF5590 domain-containing protein [Lysinibacillus alkalisoli]GGG17710.1 peptidase M4 [Lysinibacillus alkalisoli]